MDEEPNKTELTAVQFRFLKSYRDCFCNKAKACRDTDISRQTMYEWMEKFPFFKEEMERYEWEDLQNAEQVLKGQAIVGDNIKALQFFLARRHPDYKQKVTHDGEIKQKHELDDATLRYLERWNHLEPGRTGDHGVVRGVAGDTPKATEQGG